MHHQGYAARKIFRESWKIRRFGQGPAAVMAHLEEATAELGVDVSQLVPGEEVGLEGKLMVAVMYVNHY